VPLIVYAAGSLCFQGSLAIVSSNWVLQASIAGGNAITLEPKVRTDPLVVDFGLILAGVNDQRVQYISWNKNIKIFFLLLLMTEFVQNILFLHDLIYCVCVVCLFGCFNCSLR
jgi:hypothetical protein